MGRGCLTMRVICGKKDLPYLRFADRHWQPLAMPHCIANTHFFGAKSSRSMAGRADAGLPI
jgi:hypothetical protein